MVGRQGARGPAAERPAKLIGTTVATADPANTTALETSAATLAAELLLLDVGNTLRSHPGLQQEAAAEITEKLQQIYAGQGIAVDGPTLAEGVAAYRDGRFGYVPPTGWRARLAGLYVARRRWGPPTMAIALTLIIGLGGYFFAWRPFHEAQLAEAHHELTVTMPAEMDQLYQTIYTETKVQQAVTEAGKLIDSGKAAVEAGDRSAAQAAIDGLTNIRDTLREEYTLRIVNRDGEKTAFWTFPKVNTAATNYYVVVEAVDKQGKTLALPVTDENTGKTERVSIWAVRVPESVYRAVESDKLDDGVLEHGVLGIKEFGFLDLDYALPVMDGALTHW